MIQQLQLKISKFLRSDSGAYLILLLCTILFLPSLSLFKHPLSYDQNSAFFPWRYFIGECFNKGIFPYWNPYQTLGYPFHADPQSGAWYPITWLFAMDGNYTIYNLIEEYLLHIFIAGCGMFAFCRYKNLSTPISLIAGISFMWCGFFVGNAQHMSWIIAGAWLPVVVLFTYRILEQPNVMVLLMSGLSLSLMLTGGYPMIFISTVYLLFFVVLQHVWKHKKDWLKLKKMTLWLSLWVFITLLCSAGTFVSTLAALPYFSRAQGLTLEVCSHGIFSPASFISFVTPFATVRDSIFFETDQSMANAYFGLSLLVCFLLYIFTVKEKDYFWIVSALVFILLSIGAYTPLREWFFYFIPGFNISRFPSLFRLFFLFSVIPLSAVFAEKTLHQIIRRKQLFLGLKSIAFVLLATVVILLFKNKTLNISVLMPHLFNSVTDESDLKQHFFVQALLQVILIFVFIKLVKYRPLNYGRLLIGFTMVDLCLSVLLNGPHTVYTGFVKAKELQQFCDTFPKGFKAPANKTLHNYSDSTGDYSVLWQNKSIYTEVPAWDGFSSSFFKGIQPLYENCPSSFSRFIRNTTVAGFISKPGDSLDYAEFCDSLDARTLFVGSKPVRKPLADNSDSELKIQVFNPSEIRLTGHSGRDGIVYLMQNYYPGWHLFVDGHEKELLCAGGYFLAANVSSGKHDVSFIYDFKPVKISLYTEVSSIIISFILLLLILIKKKSASFF